MKYTNFLMNRCFAIAYLFQQNPKQSLTMKSKNIIKVSQYNYIELKIVAKNDQKIHSDQF